MLPAPPPIFFFFSFPSLWWRLASLIALPPEAQAAPSTSSPCSSALGTPRESRCSGCPPSLDGLPCASTTRYYDLTIGACGCGASEPVPPTWWSKTAYTAALNAKNLDPKAPRRAWCPARCGACFRLCSTGGGTTGGGTTAGVCRVFKVENRCGDGFDDGRGDDWCSQVLSHEECAADPDEACRKRGATNRYGYSAHFDLQNVNGQIDALGWDNVEVTFEEVACAVAGWRGPPWDCTCSDGGGGTTCSAREEKERTPRSVWRE